LPVVNVNWGLWAEIGLAAETVARVGDRNTPEDLKSMLAPRRAVDLLERLLGHTVVGLVVLPWEARKPARVWPERQQRTFFAEVTEGGNPESALGPRERPNLRHEYIAPRDDIEQSIAECWEQALRIQSIGMLDNFFELGGDSVLAGQVVTRINRSFNVSVSFRDFFKALTVEDLAREVRERLLSKLDSLSDEEAERLLAATNSESS
jgi:acyl carrier protein